MVASMDLLNFPNTFDDQNAVIIYGCGGHGKTLIDLVRSLGCYQLVGLIDDEIPIGSLVMGLKVLGSAAILPDIFQQGIHLAINGIGGIGNPEVRLKAFDLLARRGFTCPAVIHPTAFVEPSAIIKSGVHILAKSYVSSEALIGEGTVLNASVVVSHDCKIGKCVNLSPGAMLAGGVQVGDFVQIGMAVTINLNVSVGKGARIGNGATVKADVPPDARVHAGATWPPFESANSLSNNSDKKVK